MNKIILTHKVYIRSNQFHQESSSGKISSTLCSPGVSDKNKTGSIPKCQYFQDDFHNLMIIVHIFQIDAMF